MFLPGSQKVAPRRAMIPREKKSLECFGPTATLLNKLRQKEPFCTFSKTRTETTPNTKA
jgi:hypothetical protein